MKTKNFTRFFLVQSLWIVQLVQLSHTNGPHSAGRSKQDNISLVINK